MCLCKTLSLILFFVFKNQTWWDLANDLQMRKTNDERRRRRWRIRTRRIIILIRKWRIIILIWRWRKLLQKNKRSTIQHCDNRRNLNACRWRRLCQMKWWIRRQCLLFIELIQSRAEDETESETKNETENETENESNHQFEDDEIENENKQCRKRLNRYTKTDDAKCEDAVNRLRFIKLKSLKKLK
jgi:hypothetical protein